LSKREQGRSLLAPSDLMTIDETEVVILLPSGDPVKCTRFTYETFPVPDGYPAPERPVHPVSERFSKARLDHEQKLAQYRKQQAPFADDDELAEELPPAEQVVEEESADDQADENRSEQPCQVVATDLATTTEEQREDDELEPDSVKVREEEEDEFYVP
jgi:type IV secretory pathway TraG/TraD family ATPase VirD4